MQWLLLIYTIPPEPTRKRAFVWRELKKLGAGYLRDGVCVLPDRPATRHAMQAIVDRVRAFEGQATLVEAAVIDELSAQEVVRQSRTARQAEYTALADSSLAAHSPGGDVGASRWQLSDQFKSVCA